MVSIVALVLSLLGNLLLNFKKVKLGYLTWIISNFMWVFIGLNSTEKNCPQIIMYVIYIVLNIHGIYKWRKEKI